MRTQAVVESVAAPAPTTGAAHVPVAGGVYDATVRTTFICSDTYVRAYDHRSRTWSGPALVAGDNDSDHCSTMIQAADGHLLVFRGSLHNEVRMARSAAPHSIDGAWTDVTLPTGPGATYPMSVRTADGMIFVFVRETAAPASTRPMTYLRSTDNGQTWRSSASLTGNPWAIAPLDRADDMNEIHVGQIRYERATPLHPERVAIVYTLAGGGPAGHRYHRNLYYTYLTPSDLRFHAADGRDLGTTIDDALQEAYLKVVDTRSPDPVSLVGSTVAAWPFVVWMQSDADGHVHDQAALWSPLGGWRSREVATGIRVRDMERLDGKTWRVYGTDAGVPGVATYRLTAGTDWRPESTRSCLL